MAVHTAHPSVEAMVVPERLSTVLGRRVRSVVRRPMEPKDWSSTGAGFERVTLDDGQAPDLVIKHITWETDWLAVTTADLAGRELVVWESGILDQLEDRIDHPVLAVARFDGGAAVLMHDISDHLLEPGAPVQVDRLDGVLGSMASLHAAFLDCPPVAELGPAACPLDLSLGRLGPTGLTSLARCMPDHELVVDIGNGWRQLPDLLDPGVARELRALAEDPSPIVATLSRYPQTLLHGDFRLANVGWDGTRTIAFDWMPTVGPPGLDITYFIGSMFAQSPLHPDEVTNRYRDRLEASAGRGTTTSWWDEHIDVCWAATVVSMAVPTALVEKRLDPVTHPEWVSSTWKLARARRGLDLISAS